MVLFMLALADGQHLVAPRFLHLFGSAFLLGSNFSCLLLHSQHPFDLPHYRHGPYSRNANLSQCKLHFDVDVIIKDVSNLNQPFCNDGRYPFERL